MERRRFCRLRTGQRYETQGLIFFLAASYDRLPKTMRQIVEASCRTAAGRSQNEQALLEYVTKGKTKTEIMLKYYIASETTIDRMVRCFYAEMERRLKEWARCG